jgi:hypothetical protein|tara:strand:- start:1280 stop:1702 length:423 start_codon:yes stop_codon:yes gene_type:complete
MDIVYLKLVSGESILAYAENVDDEYVHAYKPIQLHTVNSIDGALIRTTKWIAFTDQNEFSIRIKNILVIAKPTEEIEKYYLRTLDILDDEEEDYLLEERNDWSQLFEEDKLDHESWESFENEETIVALNELAANNQIKVH